MTCCSFWIIKKPLAFPDNSSHRWSAFRS